MRRNIDDLEKEFESRMRSLNLTLSNAINVQQETRILQGKNPSKVLFRWYDELSEMWQNPA